MSIGLFFGTFIRLRWLSDRSVQYCIGVRRFRSQNQYFRSSAVSPQLRFVCSFGRSNASFRSFSCSNSSLLSLVLLLMVLCTAVAVGFLLCLFHGFRIAKALVILQAISAPDACSNAMSCSSCNNTALPLLQGLLMVKRHRLSRRFFGSRSSFGIFRKLSSPQLNSSFGSFRRL